jgi:hypothetical protein
MTDSHTKAREAIRGESSKKCNSGYCAELAQDGSVGEEKNGTANISAEGASPG